MKSFNHVKRFRFIPKRFFSSCGGPISRLPNVSQHLIDQWISKDTFEQVRQPITKATTIPPQAYYDDTYFAAEQQQIFEKQWFCVGHTAELPKNGDTKVVDVGPQSFILTKCKKGKIHAFYNVCRHRGARLCEPGDVKNRKRLNCPYHWWSYRLSGELVSTPFFDSDNFKKKDYGLLKIRVETFAGMIFVCANPEVGSLSDSLGDIVNLFKDYPLAEMDIKGVQEYNLDVDWKILAENFMEWYHVGPVHPELATFSTPEQHLMQEGSGNYVGFVTHPVTNSGGAADTTNFNPTPQTTTYDQQTAFFYHLFPNVSVTVYPHSVYTLVMLPTAPGKCKETLYLLQHPDCKLETDTQEEYQSKVDALFKFVCKVNDEDVWVVKRVSKGLRNSQYVGGRFSPDMEKTCYRFQNMIGDAMTGLYPGVYPPQMTDYYKSFPHMKETKSQDDMATAISQSQLNEEIFEEENTVYAELLNIEGTTSSTETEEQAEHQSSQTFSVVEMDPATDSMKVLMKDQEFKVLDFSETNVESVENIVDEK